ncbi:MAG: RagB/SusD family nutrient uptake outer membrane protein [Pedobacter sp.]|nr:RagB/SusD family nutrient uptake outer membrane protein [Pedobacter sp.]MDQ8052181.1 RagB/SusD family nutrient uptake outer membrane protein [Pedobacter sp.]
MIKKLIFTFFVATMVLGTGCKKLLDIKPEDFVTPEQFFTKESDAVVALNAAFDMMTRQYWYGGYNQCRMQCADDVWMTLTGLGYPGSLTITAAEPTHIPNYWNNIYTAIQYTNIVLDNLPRIPMDETRRGEIKGEALFFRAYCYFLLVDQWGAVPLKLKPTAGPNDVNYVRTPVKDVYAQIIKDMTEAEGLVPTTAKSLYGGAGYPAKTTVQGMLARVCLTMAGEPLKDASRFAQAKAWAQKVVDSKEHDLNPDYQQMCINYAAGIYDKKENLWELDLNDASATTEHGYLGYLDGIYQGLASFGNSVGQVRITRKLYELYGATTNDTRRDWNCCPFYWKTTTVAEDIDPNKTFFSATQTYERCSAKFRLQYTPAPRTVNRSPINFPLLRYADVLLMLAEADNEVNGGPTTLAYDLVDKVRARAYGKLKAGATNLTEANVVRNLNKETFLKLIQDERCREFPAEAIRKHDLIRWGIFVSSIKELKADVNNTAKPAVTTASANGTVGPKVQMTAFGDRVLDRDVLWPIPATELTFNKLATQNPGW